MVNTIVEGLFQYFNKSPLIEKSRLNISYLPEDTKKAGVEYAIATEPNEQVITRYRDGGQHCRYPFVICSVNDYGQDHLVNMASSGFMEQLSEWLREQCRKRNLPELPEGMMSRSIEAKNIGYLFEPGATAGKYQIICELQYYKN